MCTSQGYSLSRNYFGKETHFHVPADSMIEDNKCIILLHNFNLSDFTFQKSIKALELLSIELFRQVDGTQM